ncbi:Protein FAM50B like [Quillaja saponaria]|uniref:Protein FAM50B like n=1 Tax=Quillaja saponaria TaxID=32244 RepID=A0AAD7KVJ5_QUISA|nr:Protein FAM50B like [Quillaja saponaria]
MKSIMGRESQDPTLIQYSSVALLQERFRQLQRVKEMREERELLKLLTEHKQFNFNPSVNYEPTRLHFHPEMIIIPPPKSSPPHVSVTLWPTLSSTQKNNYKGLENSFATRSSCPTCQSHSLQVSWKKMDGFCDSDSDSGVDTSLHL